jgi:hypothetical protein
MDDQDEQFQHPDGAHSGACVAKTAAAMMVADRVGKQHRSGSDDFESEGSNAVPPWRPTAPLGYF